ncbi:Por secretion system C-terminal sorting domain-containing protein [Hymenobacter daecheongensis DSM 21074]|uniref:Por secretion system C-terminal sorting domain-containing protein n=1 Tax=Hymenobacter daecheongensis DSM 21074 TaxID=1121955 RepID=A0A1M6GJZ3_9BACT|nr:zinc-dependent metalloprotease family protein [Hymenobacter daecheongensis]SHJ10275.1 Por secretion system C-terminal sorting domain-containing protein [Hymenobacter daecheongensis DSM 21074]
MDFLYLLRFLVGLLAPVSPGRLGRRAALLLLLASLVTGTQAQHPASFFQADAAARSAASPLARALFHSRALTLDVAGLRAALATAPRETQASAAPLVLALPLPDGRTGRFAIREAQVMAPALAAQFPAIKTYAGTGLDDASASVRLDLTPQGFHAQVLTADGKSFYIDPVTRTDAGQYLAFYTNDMDRAAAGPAMTCGFAPSAAELKASEARVAAYARSAAALASGPVLKTYRLAMAATGEYTTFHGGTVASALAAIVTSVNRVVGVYEKELAVRLVLVANTDLLIYTNAATDPYANTSGDLAANVATINSVIGSANYDIGHLYGTGGGGVAGLGVVCGASKARGLTGSSSPVGDAFDIDYVAHEIGHQFSGNHPFNGNGGSCSGGNRNASTAWEPGSGSTIMAYAGICGAANNLQPNSDATFHTGNYQEMRAFISGTTCGTSTATGNTAPVVAAPASGLTLPGGTPFKLTATATDAEGDALTYSWEEMDLGPQQSPTAPQVAGQNVPLFRSFNPTASGTRYFPRLNELVNNTTLIGERLPTVTRTLKFRCTARDAHSGPAGVIGGVDYSAFVNLNVSSAAGPFVVTAPNTAVTWTGGTSQTVTWDVAGTTAAPVSCALVNLRLSLDGGLTYPTLLAANEANDGSAVVVAPSFAGTQTQVRVMVEAADNYFFDISNANFTITPAPLTLSSLSPNSGVAGTVVTLTGTGFTGATGISFNGTAAATFSVTNATTATATVPAGATTGNVTLTTPVGTSNGVLFTVCAPQAIAQDATVALDGTGNVSITAATVNNGSTANCGFAAGGGLSVSPSAFTCANLGPNSVTLTVTDAQGNTSSATATVTVLGTIPTPGIAVTPATSVFTGGIPTNLYLGYGPRSATLTASELGSAVGVTYAWSPATNLSNANSANPVFTPTLPGTFTFTVTATSSSGCTATASVTLKVVDVRCGSKNDKVLVCHNGNQLCIAPNGVRDHLTDHPSDRLGACPGLSARVASSADATGSANELAVYPNPTGSQATVSFRAPLDGHAQVVVYNALGQRVAALYDGEVSGGQQYAFVLDGQPLTSGLYYCRLVVNGKAEMQRLIIAR